MIERVHLRISGDGVQFHAVAAGAGAPVLLLHGFPESARAAAPADITALQDRAAEDRHLQRGARLPVTAALPFG